MDFIEPDHRGKEIDEGFEVNSSAAVSGGEAVRENHASHQRQKKRREIPALYTRTFGISGRAFGRRNSHRCRSPETKEYRDADRASAADSHNG